MTTNARKPKTRGPRTYTVKNIYRNYSSDKEKTLNITKLANDIAQIITAKQQEKTSNPMGKIK